MARSRVVIIKAAGGVDPGVPSDGPKLRRMFQRGFALLTGEREDRSAVMSVFRPADRLGIKVNTIGGRAISTRPEVSLALAGWLAASGLADRNILVWDRTNRELRDAGYRLSRGPGGPQVFGTDADGAGYGGELVAHLNVGSLFSKIQSDFATASISLAILKDHGLAGVTAGMKNYFGAIHNPNKYHDFHCDPFVAEVFDAPPVKAKHRLSILDALVVQYHRGPSFHPQWAEKYGGLVFSFDPVAADRVGWALVERFRAAKGLPSLKEEAREPMYLATAERMGLGLADLASIETVEEDVP
ncbi:MAG TPA: DUF362 domain-containing protein [Burkholderiales bacterium]|nr:DUF362 domain-containing protein [Burkholderiales bacterium]